MEIGWFTTSSTRIHTRTSTLAIMKLAAIIIMAANVATTVEAFVVPASPVPTSSLSSSLSYDRRPSSKSLFPKMPLVNSDNTNINNMRSHKTLLSQSSAVSSSSAAPDENSNNNQLRKYAARFCNLFPIWTLLTAATALSRPQTFLSIPASTFPAQIGLLMLCMGISLSPSDFKRVAQRPMAVLLAFVGCYGVMPALAVLLGKLLLLPQQQSLAHGLVLVSCINGAQASNLCTFIGQGDLALSILMTTMTTIGAIVMTPLMGKLLLGKVIPVNAAAMSLSTIQVVLVPILLGMLINQKAPPKLLENFMPFSPIIGVLVTCLLVGTSVAGCAGPILNAGARLQAAAALLHLLGGVVGYLFTKPFYGEDVCRTFAIEFAMKSSAFGYLLATLHFPDAMVRVPSAVSIVWMTLIGSSFAVASRFFPPEECVVPDEA